MEVEIQEAPKMAVLVRYLKTYICVFFSFFVKSTGARGGWFLPPKRDRDIWNFRDKKPKVQARACGDENSKIKEKLSILNPLYN